MMTEASHLGVLQSLADFLTRFADASAGLLTSTGLLLAVSLAIRCWWRLRTHAGMAAVAVVALAAFNRKRVAGVYLVGMAALAFVRLTGWITGPGGRQVARSG